MTQPDPGTGRSRIPEHQNQSRHQQRLRAYTHLYDIAQRWRRLRTTGTIALALLGPVFALLSVDTRGILAAISAAWLLLSRTLLIRLESNARNQAVRIHELFDTGVFALPWNTTIAGPEPLHDDVARAARAVADHPRFHNWYDLDLSNTTWPIDVLLCQRQAMAWSRSDHRGYATALAIAAAAWFLLGLTIALLSDLSLADYLVKLFLPTAPALLDAIELHAAHRRHATTRETQLVRIDTRARDHFSGTKSITPAHCRRVQDCAFLIRAETHRVPGWFYRLRRAGSQADTADAHQELRDDPNS